MAFAETRQSMICGRLFKSTDPSGNGHLLSVRICWLMRTVSTVEVTDRGGTHRDAMVVFRSAVAAGGALAMDGADLKGKRIRVTASGDPAPRPSGGGVERAATPQHSSDYKRRRPGTGSRTLPSRGTKATATNPGTLTLTRGQFPSTAAAVSAAVFATAGASAPQTAQPQTAPPVPQPAVSHTQHLLPQHPNPPQVHDARFNSRHAHAMSSGPPMPAGKRT